MTSSVPRTAFSRRRRKSLALLPALGDHSGGQPLILGDGLQRPTANLLGANVVLLYSRVLSGPLLGFPLRIEFPGLQCLRNDLLTFLLPA